MHVHVFLIFITLCLRSTEVGAARAKRWRQVVNLQAPVFKFAWGKLLWPEPLTWTARAACVSTWSGEKGNAKGRVLLGNQPRCRTISKRRACYYLTFRLIVTFALRLLPGAPHLKQSWLWMSSKNIVDLRRLLNWRATHVHATVFYSPISFARGAGATRAKLWG